MSGLRPRRTLVSALMTISDEIGLVWFRRDLRLDDNPAWAAATSHHRFVVPLFVIDPRLLARVGPFRRRQLLATLQALDYELAESGGRLLIRIGDPVRLVPETAAALSVGAVYWNDDVSPFAVTRDAKVEAGLPVPAHRSWGTLVHPPGTVLTAKGTLSRVFTPFYKAWSARPGTRGPSPATPSSSTIRASPCPPSTGRRRCSRARRRPTPGSSSSSSAWTTTAPPATAPTSTAPRCSRPTSSSAPCRPAPSSTWWATRRPGAWPSCASSPGATGTPTCSSSCRDCRSARCAQRFDEIEWRNDPGDVAAWKGGFTGFPIVDAGMRQLPRDGLDAQPGAHDRGVVPGQGPPRRLADRRAPLPAPAGRRRRLPERRQLAVGGGHRSGRLAVPPRLQPGHPEPEVRPHRGLHPAVGARAGLPRRQGHPRPVGGGRRSTWPPPGSPWGRTIPIRS